MHLCDYDNLRLWFKKKVGYTTCDYGVSANKGKRMFPAGERCTAIAAAQVVLPSRRWSFHLSCRGLVISHSLAVAKQVFDRDRNWMLKASSAHVVTIKIFFALMTFFSHPPRFARRNWRVRACFHPGAWRCHLPFGYRWKESGDALRGARESTAHVQVRQTSPA